MNSVAANQLIQPMKKQKNMFFILPTIIMIIFVLICLFENIANLHTILEVPYDFQYGYLENSGRAFDEYQDWQSTRIVGQIANLVFTVPFLFFIIACIKKIKNNNSKTFSSIFFVSLIFSQLFWVVWSVVQNSAYYQFMDVLYADNDWYASFGELLWQNLLINLLITTIPLVIWYTLLLLTEFKDLKGLRIATIVIGIVVLVKNVILNMVVSYSRFSSFDSFVDYLIRDFENLIGFIVQLFVYILSNFNILAIVLYQVVCLRKPKVKMVVANNVPIAQPVQPVYQQPQPVQPARPVQPVYQQPVAPPPAPQQSAEEKLMALKRLFDDNAITQEEYDKKREEILKTF